MRRTKAFYRVIKRCIAQKDLVLGSRVHALIVKSGYESDAFLGNHIIGMYALHGRLEEARLVFTKMAAPNPHVWASIIKAHTDHGQPFQAIKLYHLMKESTVKPDNYVFAAVLKACATAGDLSSGEEVHVDVLWAAVEHHDVFVSNCLVEMYTKCGSLEDARRVFDGMTRKNHVTWNAMIAGYAQNGMCDEALALHGSMLLEGITGPDRTTFACLLKACIRSGALHEGKKLHFHIHEKGLETDVIVGSCLVDLYAKCGSMEDARKVFDRLPVKNVVTWNSMLGGYAEKGLGQEAVFLYGNMQQDGSVVPDCVTFVCLLKACASARDLHEGKKVHSQILESGLEVNVFVGSCLVDMYVKCGSVRDARRVFDNLLTRDVVTWNCMIAGYVDHGLWQEAFSLYASMQQEGMTPSDVTIVCLLKACARVGALKWGKQLHKQIEEGGAEMDASIGNCLVDMYAKCGSLEDACKVFDKLPTRDVVTWTALLNGYSEHSNARMAISCFEKMLQQGVEPNDATFVCILTACSHEGLVNEGRHYFKMMEHHGISPTASHYNCMVDLLGRSGCLDESETMLQTSPFGDDVVGWRSLLSACKSHGDIERGRHCFERLIELDPQDARAYVMLANMHASAGMWKDVDRLEDLRKSVGAWKKPAKACIEVEKKVHEFTVGQGTPDISSKLKSMNLRLEGGGHVPHTQLVLKMLPETEKEDALCGHAEKLALAYGLLNTPDGTSLLVTKNLRMCNDCHSSTKVVSRLEKREIIVRDAHRVHRFVDGSCSCGDWL